MQNQEYTIQQQTKITRKIKAANHFVKKYRAKKR